MENVIKILKQIRPEFEFAGIDDFFARGMLDSLDLTTLISALEEHYGIAVNGVDIVPENFRNVETILNFIQKHKIEKT